MERHREAISRLTESTRRNRRVALENLLRHVGDKRLVEVSRFEIAAWLGALQQAGGKLSTVGLKLAQSVAFFGWAETHLTSVFVFSGRHRLAAVSYTHARFSVFSLVRRGGVPRRDRQAPPHKERPIRAR